MPVNVEMVESNDCEPPLALDITAQQRLYAFSRRLTNSDCTNRQIVSLSDIDEGLEAMYFSSPGLYVHLG